MIRSCLSALCAALLLSACAGAPKVQHRVSDPDALWKIINTHCLVADARTRAADCVAVWPDPVRRAVVLKDRHGDFQYLVIPMDKVSGIESDALLHDGAPNYFAASWEARGFVQQALGRELPRQVTSLALNSPHGRSQEQLHIHVDCIRPDVRDQLDRMQAGIATRWQELPERLLGHRYLARFVPGETLHEDPIRLLATSLRDGHALGDYGLVVVGAQDAGGAPGFVLLATRHDVDDGNKASAEELQDHACGLVTGADQVLDGVR